jgi:exopolysaccharide production protein ExoQ
MNSNFHSFTKPGVHVGRTPWILFLFLAAVFFLNYHDLYFSKRGIDNFNPSEEDITAGVAEGSPTRRVALLSLGLYAIVSLLHRRTNGRTRIDHSLGWVLLGFEGWAFLSLVWSEDPSLTFRRLVAFGIFCIAAVVVARRLSLREIILWTFFTSALFLVIGISAEVFLNTFRPLTSGYRFAGTIDPNNQGVNCALLLLSGVAAANVEKHRRELFLVGAMLGFVFLILTASRTSFAAALLALVIYLAEECSGKSKIAIAYGLTTAFCVFLMVLGNAILPTLRSAVMLGKDGTDVTSFHGRSGIWEDVGPYIDRRPILGYGYGGFWTPAHISEISEEEKWGVPNSHSAYLDYLLELGAVGLVLYVLLLFGGIRRAFRFHKLSRNPAYAFCGALLMFCVVDGLLESAVASPSFLMFLCLVTLASLAFKNMLQPELVRPGHVLGLRRKAYR